MLGEDASECFCEVRWEGRRGLRVQRERRKRKSGEPRLALEK
jgi:hypothetical protein